MKQVLILPISFFCYSSIGIRGVGGSMDSLLGIHCRTISMSWNMRSCHSLTCGTGSRAGGTIFSYFTGSSMRVKRSLTNNCHLKYPCIYPCLKCFDSLSRTMILRIFFLKVGHDTLGTINGPDG